MEGTVALLDNPYFTIFGTNVRVVHDFSDAKMYATAMTSISIVYKKCNIQTITITPTSFAENVKNPTNPNNKHVIIRSGNSLIFKALSTKLDVQTIISKYLSVTISTSFTGPGMCLTDERLEIMNTEEVRTRSIGRLLETNSTVCDNATGVWREACLFDFGVTNDTSFAASTAVTQLQYTEIQNFDFISFAVFNGFSILLLLLLLIIVL